MFSASSTFNPAYPGPVSWFPWQNVIALRTRTLQFLTEMHESYGDVVQFRIGKGTYLMLSRPDAIRDVLVTKADCFSKGPALRLARGALGLGLLTSEGDFHRRQRRLCQPAFHSQRVNTYAPAMIDYARQTSQRWRDGQIIDLHREMMRLTLRIVVKTLFGSELSSEVDDLGRAMDITVGMFTRAMSPWGPMLNVLPLPSNFRFKQAQRRLRGTLDGMIAQRRTRSPGGNDLLSTLVRASDEATGGMDDQQLRDESMTIFTAGHETTANALTFTLFLLSRHPLIQTQLNEELNRVIGSRAIETSDVEDLPFTRAVFAESMRLYPPAWALGRQATQDVEVGGVQVPAEAVVLLSQWVVHRDPKWWEAPLEFRPRRWIQSDPGIERHRWSYFPFGGGPRQCIGESFAWKEGMLVLAALAREWRFEATDSSLPRLLPTITLRPRSVIRLRVARRASGASG